MLWVSLIRVQSCSISVDSFIFHLFFSPSEVSQTHMFSLLPVCAQGRLMCLGTAFGRKGASCFLHVQVGALCLECQCEHSGRTGLTFFSVSLHMRDLSDYEIIAYGLQRNISAVVLLSLYLLPNFPTRTWLTEIGLELCGVCV